MQPGTDAPRGARAPELVLVLVAAVGLVGAQLWATDSFGLLGRMFWLDEVYTHTLVADPSLTHAMDALAHGVETHPPAFYLAARLFTRLVSSSDETALRAFALLSVLVGLLGIYALLRLTFTWWASAAALGLVWAHPLIVAHAFDARFYGPWLAGVAWVAYGLARARHRKPGATGVLLLAAGAAFVCTVHYFGIVTLLLIVGGEIWARRADGAPLLTGMTPLLAGPLALAACVPFLLGQRAALAVATWQPSVTVRAVAGFVAEVLLPTTLALVALAAWVAVLLTRGRLAKAWTADPSAQAGASALLLLPLVLVGFSIAVQTALVPRYALPAVVGLAPAAAFLLARLSWPGALAVGACLVLVSSQEVRARAQTWEEEDRFVSRLIADVRTRTNDAPVFFESPARLYVLCRYAPELAPRCFLIDFEPGELGNTSPNRIFMRDLSRRFDEYYGAPRSQSWDRIKSLGSFYLVKSFIPGGRPGAAEYPGFRQEPISGPIYRAVRDGPR